MSLDDRLTSLRDYFGAYHHHKEQMAFAAATLYLGGATALVFDASHLRASGPPSLSITLVLIATSFIGFLFVFWQLKNRILAAGIVEGCNALLSETASPSQTPEVVLTNWRGVSLPAPLVAKLGALSASTTFLAEPRKVRRWTIVIMSVWTFLAGYALYCPYAA